MNHEQQNSSKRILLGFGVFVVASGIGFALVFSMLGSIPLGAKLPAILLGVVGIFVGLIVTVAVRTSGSRGSTIVPALVTLGCAFLLTGGSVVGFLATCKWEGQQDPSNAMFGWLAAISAATFVFALLWVLIAAIVAFFRAGRTGGKGDSAEGQSR